MQRLWSSCIRSRSLIYAPPRSFLIAARFNSSESSPSKVLSSESSSKVLLSQEFSDKAVDTAQLATAKAVSSSDDIWNEKSKHILADTLRSPPANAYSGRTVLNMRGSELAHAFRQLDNIMSRNKVRYQLKRTFRHEKKGAKRRRLKSERWRKQFANAVREKVKLVVKIRKRGA